VLFSEPKIPQYERYFHDLQHAYGFSALQRAENSSILISARLIDRQQPVSVLFSEPKIPQFVPFAESGGDRQSFSALQRAENSSIINVLYFRRSGQWFQCSSASRKFLNPASATAGPSHSRVSVLFSEPKIPQSHLDDIFHDNPARFSALQRAENSSIRCVFSGVASAGACFSALQRAENSSIEVEPPEIAPRACFSALQRAENSSICWFCPYRSTGSQCFSALQRAENSSI